MVNWRVRDKTPCPLNKSGQMKKWLSRQLELRDSWHNELLLSRTRVFIIIWDKRKNDLKAEERYSLEIKKGDEPILAPPLWCYTIATNEALGLIIRPSSAKWLGKADYPHVPYKRCLPSSSPHRDAKPQRHCPRVSRLLGYKDGEHL